MVRYTKLALYRVLGLEGACARHPTEVLRTLLHEAASLLNSRPLTYVSSDVKDDRALTPNDLLGKPPTADVPPPGPTTTLSQFKVTGTSSD